LDSGIAVPSYDRWPLMFWPAVVFRVFRVRQGWPDDVGDHGQGLRSWSSREPPGADGTLQDDSCHRVQLFGCHEEAPASAFRAASNSTYRRSERLAG